jgi:hypothetical protein
MGRTILRMAPGASYTGDTHVILVERSSGITIQDLMNPNGPPLRGEGVQCCGECLRVIAQVVCNGAEVPDADLGKVRQRSGRDRCLR